MGSALNSCVTYFYNGCCCECNGIIFPAPTPTYSKQENRCSQKIRICQFIKNANGTKIPYLQMEGTRSDKIMIYFHGNAQDIGTCSDFLLPIQNQTGFTFYAIQYPTYGCYKNSNAYLISDAIKADALSFFDYIVEAKKIKKQNVYVFGRSIGSGPASYLASKRQLNYLILMSPFSTIKDVAQDFVGCAGIILKQHFNNLQSIDQYKGKILVIHGKIDDIIAYKHGVSVYEKHLQHCKQKCLMVSPSRMSHNYFHMKNDIVGPICKFIEQNSSQNKQTLLFQ